MDVFDLQNRLVDDYAKYTRSFINISDPRIDEKVTSHLKEGAFWPTPLLQLNPTFKPGGTIDDLVADGTLHEECARIFRTDKSDTDHTGNQLVLHTHQTEAIKKAKENKSYVLTSGTGSGKSLTYIVPIVDHVLRNGSGKGIRAIVVYPMNALANSQNEELTKFLVKGYEEDKSPIRFARYTGQENTDEREKIRANPPDILLTNYMMLELLLTRGEDRALVRAAQGLRFLVLDELHTYRGRQGADVALLIRRCRLAFTGNDMICVGTSATMASGGSSVEQKNEVAAVARTLFGTNVTSAQVIGETLERSTPERDFKHPEVVSSLRNAVEHNTEPPDSPDSFRKAPLSSWIESTFGVQSEGKPGLLVRQPPRRLRGTGSAAEELSCQTQIDADRCANVLQSYLLRGSALKARESSRFPIFAFRLHQFFTRGDTIWATMEPEETRHLELAKLGAKPGEPEKPLFPLVFCRQCGTAYYRTSLCGDKGDRDRQLEPREDRQESKDGVRKALLYVSAEAPWPRSDGQDLLNRLPAFMKEATAEGGEKIRPHYRQHVPEAVFVDSAGKLVSEGMGIAAALVMGDFRFCLNPDCSVAYATSQRSEKTSLGTLGVDSRSTATTILAMRSLIALQEDSDLKAEARKLLSFTDNRQDASLQAGHFNDFTQVALLRSALHKATSLKNPRGLTHGELSGSVFDALNLRFDEYAADPDVRGVAHDDTINALRQVIDYHLYRDLRRGWRVTAPNLEDCGLLQFEYGGLAGERGLLDDKELWASGFSVQARRNQNEYFETPGLLRDCPAETREEILRTLLDVLRWSLALKVDVLEARKQQELVNQSSPRLLEGTIWHIEDSRELVKSTVAYPRSQRRNDRSEDKSGIFISSRHRYGRYLHRTFRRQPSITRKAGRDDIDQVIGFLFRALKRYGIVEQVRSGDAPGYQINPGALRWIAGKGEQRPVDRTRLAEAGEIQPAVNEYFRSCYESFVDLKVVLEAREHTAQVASEDRKEREDRFREGDLPLLFCSPTMELGVDIAQLNLVNLRNVPPTPANYAQRSGRAGRSGQPALVYTYCAGRSPHDQYYFRQPDQMVSGIVAPPRIDLCNRDLVRSHVHAIWMEVAKPDLGRTLTSVVDISGENGRIPLPVKESIQRELSNPVHRRAALEKANQFVASIGEIQTAPWFHDHWTKEIVDQIERSFDTACDRWRELYRSAVAQRKLHHGIIGDHARSEKERSQSRRLRNQAEQQIRLLTEIDGIYDGDFYSYRYFAAEGFLPGYNFPRLPLSAWVPGRRRRKGRDEFVSRPRFLAISEFGPRALVYHEGARYRVYKTNLDFGPEDIDATRSLPTATMKRCTRCGYAHLEQGTNLAEVCGGCGSSLDNQSVISNLVRMQNVSLQLAERITCDEEERQRSGYHLVSSYKFPEVDGQRDQRDSEVTVNGKQVMKLSYGDATELYRINRGWANQGPGEAPGFNLDLEKGYWSRHTSEPRDRDDAAASGRTVRVVPYVTDTRNALIMRFLPGHPEAEMAALQAAFKEAIQKHFQLEPRELSCEAMPSQRDRKEVLFYEATEGGAGVLRHIVEDPKLIPVLAARALEICHFNPETLQDNKADKCGKACYECLLDYGNQLDHRLLDRHRIRDILAELTRSEPKPAGGAGSRSERLVALRKCCDSKLEERWLDRLDALGLRLPSDAQYLIERCSTRPDFYYRKFDAAIYVDGPPHDAPDQIRADETITQRLLEAGYAIIRFHHKADWDEIFRRHQDIFGVASK